MAKLNQRLELTNGTNRVIEDPVPVSGIKAAVEFATEAIGGYVQLKGDIARSKAAEKAAKDEKDKASIAYEVAGAEDRTVKAVGSQGAASRAAQATLDQPAVDMTPGQFDTGNIQEEDGVFSVKPVTMSPAITTEITRSAQRGMSISAAVEQGRMPPISFNAAMNADFRRLRDKYPDQVPYILKIYKETGLDANLFTEAKDAQDEHAFERESRQGSLEDARKRDEGYIAAYESAHGAAAVAMTREQKIVGGMEIEKLDYELSQADRRRKAVMDDATIDDATKKRMQTDIDDTLATTLGVSIYNDAQPYIREITQVSDALMRNPNDPGAIQQFQTAGVKANQLVGQWVEKAVTLAQSKGYKGDPEKLRKDLTAKWGPVLDVFRGDFSVVNVNTTALKSMETNFKLTMAQAIPVFTGLKAAGLDPAAMPAVMDAIAKNPELSARLSAEMKGFLTDFGQDRASTHTVNLVKLLRGETSLTYLDPAQAGKVIPTLVNSTLNLSKQYVRDPKSVDGEMILNGAGEIVTNVRALGPSNSVNALFVASNGFASPTVRGALIQSLKDGGVDSTLAKATVQASRAGSAQMLDYYRLQVGDVNKSSPYFKVAWDNKNGRYALDNSGQVSAVKQARSGASGTPTSSYVGGLGVTTSMRSGPSAEQLSRLQAPENIRRFINGANMNLDNALEIGRHDETTPNATDIELRNYYGQNKSLPLEPITKPVDYDKSLNSMLENVDKSLTSALDQVSKSGVVLDKDLSKSDNFKAHGPVVVKAAQQYGVPEQIALALVGKESKFNPGARGPVLTKGSHKGDRAEGLGQVMAKTAAAYGVTDRSSLNPAQQADLSMRILADNYRTSGSWKDAVSMYFSGVGYDQAVKEGRNDGFNSIIQYIGDIL